CRISPGSHSPLPHHIVIKPDGDIDIFSASFTARMFFERLIKGGALLAPGYFFHAFSVTTLRRHGHFITLPQSQNVFLPLLLESVHVDVAEDLLQGPVAGRVFFLMSEELAVEAYQ